jgi:hypothetical protein
VLSGVDGLFLLVTKRIGQGHVLPNLRRILPSRTPSNRRHLREARHWK